MLAWACVRCTLINPKTAQKCEGCESPQSSSSSSNRNSKNEANKQPKELRNSLAMLLEKAGVSQLLLLSSFAEKLGIDSGKGTNELMNEPTSQQNEPTNQRISGNDRTDERINEMIKIDQLTT